MEYVISLLEHKLREEQEFVELPFGFDNMRDIDKAAFRMSSEIAERRIPQLKSALKILNEEKN